MINHLLLRRNEELWYRGLVPRLLHALGLGAWRIVRIDISIDEKHSAQRFRTWVGLLLFPNRYTLQIKYCLNTQLLKNVCNCIQILWNFKVRWSALETRMGGEESGIRGEERGISGEESGITGKKQRPGTSRGIYECKGCLNSWAAGRSESMIPDWDLYGVAKVDWTVQF